MQVSAWEVATWPAVEWYMPKRRTRWPTFTNGGTNVGPDSHRGQVQGTSVWVADLDDARIGLAWDWAELGRGVVALIDPNSICSNLRFVRDEDHYESELPSALALSRLVHSVRWHQEVMAAIHQVRAPAERRTPQNTRYRDTHLHRQAA